VSVMHVPIDDGDALGTVAALCMAGSNRNIVEKAKTHCCGTFGMMSRRASRNEHIICGTRKYIVNRRRRSTDGRQCGIHAFRADIRVTVELHHGRWSFLVRSRLRYSGTYGFQMFFRMCKKHSRLVGARCFNPVEPVEIRPLQ